MPPDTSESCHLAAQCQEGLSKTAACSAPEPSLAEILARLAPADLVIVEGFKSEPIPKIEVRRKDASTGTSIDMPDVIAIASDTPDPEAPLPVFALDDIAGISEFIIERFSLETANARALG